MIMLATVGSGVNYAISCNIYMTLLLYLQWLSAEREQTTQIVSDNSLTDLLTRHKNTNQLHTQSCVLLSGTLNSSIPYLYRYGILEFNVPLDTV